MFPYSALLSLVAVAPLLANAGPYKRADVPLYGKCGGIDYTGDTTCVSGSYCSFLNPYYSQCLPGAGSQPPAVSSTRAPTVTTSVRPPVTTTVSSVAPPVVTGSPAAANPYTGYEVYLSPYYAAEVRAAAAAIKDPVLAARALKVASIPTFIWFDVIAKTSNLGTYLAEALAIQKRTGKKQLVQIVVYDLPDRDCAALASNGEFQIINGGDANYRRYVDQLVAEIKKYPEIRVVAVIEPDSLANMITNLNVPKCAGAQESYKNGVVYALKALSAVNVYSYIDAGHAGWLGWPANLPGSATLFANIYKAAGSSPYIKGLATNVSNYNALRAATPDPVTVPNPNYDENTFINAFSPLLRSAGFPATFIVDQGRSGVQNIRQAWGNWCNVKGAGFGTRPTLATGNPVIDAIVWIKPGGEADGTSDTSAVRYDGFCGKPDAFIPSPEAGTWHQAYFEMLVRNSNPSL